VKKKSIKVEKATHINKLRTIKILSSALFARRVNKNEKRQRRGRARERIESVTKAMLMLKKRKKVF
jgi:hypothetical protein